MSVQWFAAALAEAAWWWWLLAGLVLGVIGLCIVLTFLVVMPADYLAPGGIWLSYRHTHRGWAVIVMKNIAGAALLFLGLLMLALPGPGVLTIAIGLTLLDFPGKRQLQWRLLHLPGALDSVNRLRAWFGRPPLRLGSAPAGC